MDINDKTPPNTTTLPPKPIDKPPEEVAETPSEAELAILKELNEIRALIGMPQKEGHKEATPGHRCGCPICLFK